MSFFGFDSDDESKSSIFSVGISAPAQPSQLLFGGGTPEEFRDSLSATSSLMEG